MNIYQRLVEVRKSVPYLKKDNAGYQFKYVSSSQTLGALREAMDANALLLIPRVTDIAVSDHTTRKGDHEYFTALNVEFTWINAENPEETIVCPWYGQGLDDGEKGVGKALTYAEKFFLLKFFNIATDKDDPDSFQDKNDKKEDKKPNQPKNDTPANDAPVMASDAQVKAIHSILSAKAPGEDHLLWVNDILKLIGKDGELEHISTATITKAMAKTIFDAFDKLGWTKKKEG